ncbi:acyltransferase family protein [Mucilaginibacter sp.]|uniref:acyltransferase family protein n=1 Tax=Mucilaginibacter sp. TaxID=1882438 RepID=UPI003D0FE55C
MVNDVIKINQLTFTRFLAALFIVVFHYGKLATPFNKSILSNVFSNANVCVSFFFVLSGFIMVVAYHHLKKLNLKEYYINRFSRIYPVYFIALVLTIVINNGWRFDLTGTSLHVLLLQSWVPRYTMVYNYPGWSLSVEAFFYLLFPLLYNYVYNKFRFNNIILAILAFFLISQVCIYLISNTLFDFPFPVNLESNFIHYFPLFHLNEFLAGNALGLLFICLIKKNGFSSINRVKNIALILMCTVISLLVLYPNLRQSLEVNFHNGLFVLFFGPFILWLSLSKNKLTKLLAAKPLVFFGNISYDIYILQYPVFSLLIILNRKFNWGNTPLFYLSLIVLIIASIGCHLVIEKPLLRLIRKYR